MAGPGPERTEDGRYVVVRGRRRRASDPGIPEVLRQQLVDELMDARRAVGAAARAGDEAVEVEARARVQAAKVALGERGHPWWRPADDDARRQRLEAAVLALARRRAPDKTICPSDAARAVGGEAWRDDMDLAREVVRALAVEGRVEVLQRGEPVPADDDWRGPIRVRYSGGGAGPA
ncbi:MAG TPA: DUF3253 domain-containing protein [Acidimicrobiaceae bacterium]|nr:DUF3253 domain-containing protein [Acidimicrobiaceae bacterium]